MNLCPNDGTSSLYINNNNKTTLWANQSQINIGAKKKENQTQNQTNNKTLPQ